MPDLHSDKLTRRFNLFFTDEQANMLFGMAGDSGLSAGELFRRTLKVVSSIRVDNVSVLDMIAPEISGFTTKYQIG